MRCLGCNDPNFGEFTVIQPFEYYTVEVTICQKCGHVWSKASWNHGITIKEKVDKCEIIDDEQE